MKVIGTIDLTPEGCKTEEGAKRVERTMNTLENTRAEMANRSVRFLSEYGSVIKQLAKCDDDGADIILTINELVLLGKQMNEDQEEFMLAVGNRPSRKKAQV